ncbi:cytochrome C oxidase copper chaperone-domain-containing protein [Crucibulum laeve]|uniref:Cytochrome C oxidase copper chaperone-domain-containing protein n=1 Tax=Crucibulum laeve TaxID=68775 RepID=A0A5C3LNZ4_9AGAR|nr:cytochrome C oxidase copper chaperone-domain-containing protein [Crucibulum laeve]
MIDKITSWWSSSSKPAVAPATQATDKPYNPSDPKQNPLNPEGLKPCCACPQTKSARDDCFLKFGDEADEKCKDIVANHLACMRGLGFKV